MYSGIGPEKSQSMASGMRKRLENMYGKRKYKVHKSTKNLFLYMNDV